MFALSQEFVHSERLFGAGGRYTMTQFEDVARTRLKEWIVANCKRLRLTPSGVAGELKLAKTTLTDFLNDRHATRIPSGRTLAKLEAFFGERAPRLVDDLQETRYLGEPTLEPFDYSTAEQHEADTIRFFMRNSASQSAWRITSRALVKIGLAPGDLIILDTAIAPDPNGSLVVADVFDVDTKARRRVVRIFDQDTVPILSAATLDEELRRPILVDGKTVRVVGVVVWQFVDRTKRRRVVQLD